MASFGAFDLRTWLPSTAYSEMASFAPIPAMSRVPTNPPQMDFGFVRTDSERDVRARNFGID
jgi:hypothetical protein